jgi:hypothetical protein
MPSPLTTPPCTRCANAGKCAAAEAVRLELQALARELSLPPSRGMLAEGWEAPVRQAALAFVDDLRRRLAGLTPGELRQVAQFSLCRGLHTAGITSGELYERCARLGNLLAECAAHRAPPH